MAVVARGGKGCSGSGASIDNYRFQVHILLFLYRIAYSNYE